MNKLFFPQGTLHIDDNQPVREIAFSICGGRKPAAGWLQMTAEKLPGTPEFFAADRGLNYYHAARFYPDKVIGDGDSADPVLWQQAVEQGKAEVFPVDKNETDLQLLLEILPPEKLWILSGVYGGRLDHLLSAFETLGTAALQKNRTIVLADEKKSKVSITGTKWQLEETELSRNNPFAISNGMSETEMIRELPHVSFTCHTGMTVFYIAG